MASLKSVFFYAILLALNFYIECLLLFAYCVNLVLEYLKDPPPVTEAALVPMAEKTGAGQDGATCKNEISIVKVTSTEAQIQSHPPSPSSPSPPLSFVSAPQNKIPVAPLASLSVTPDIPSTPAAPATWMDPAGSPLPHPQRMDTDMLAGLDPSIVMGFRRTPGVTNIPWNISGSSWGGHNDQLRLIVPCWGREDVIGEGSACPITLNPNLIAPQGVLVQAIARVIELEDKFKAEGGGSSLLERAIHIFDHIFAVSHRDTKFLGLLLCQQGCTRAMLFDATGEVSLVDKSIESHQAALSLIPSSADPERRTILRSMGIMLGKRYDKTETREDLDDAIEAYREALATWPRDQDSWLDLINHLGTALFKRCEKAGNVSDVENTIQLLESSLSDVGDRRKGAFCINTLGIAFRLRCEMLGSVADVDRAIRYLEEALSLQADDTQYRPQILNNVAMAFRTRYDMLGKVSDLDDAIRLYHEALLLAKDDPIALNNLAGALGTRYTRTRDASDLGQAIFHLEKAISALDHNHPARLVCLSNLAVILANRYDVSRDVADLNKAISLHEQDLSLQPAHHPQRPKTLMNLSNALLGRYSKLRNVADKNRTLGCLREALSLIPSHHPERQLVLFNFLFYSSALAPWDALPIDDLTGVLNQCTELAKLTPQQHPNYSKTMTLVVDILLTCRDRDLDIHQLLLAIGLDSESTAEGAAYALFERGSKASASPSIYRLEAMCKWIKLCQALNHPCTLEMFTRMFDLLDLSIARGCSLETRHVQISQDSKILRAKRLVSEAVAFAIDQDVIETAVEFLERGQSILLAQLSRYRSSPLLDSLHSVKPDLAKRFSDLSWQVEHATFTEGKSLLRMGPERPHEDPISRSNRLKTDWEEVVQQIRALDGFHHFLRPTPFCALRQASAEGPVILINISESHSDAIIVIPDQPPTTVPLPFATPDQVDRLASTFKAAPQSMSNRKALDGLKAIWDTIVEPVVTELQDTLKLPKNSRIWWCPTSSVVSLPLHATGLYQLKRDQCPFTRNCLPSLYLSSYTPSLGALIRAREGRNHYAGPPSVLLVGQPSTPGQPEIPEVREEIRLIKERIPHATKIMDEDGTRDAVLSGVVENQWIHLACHGHVQSDNPLQSHFSLHDGPLSLLEIMQQRLPLAEFAFLSACHSASGDSSTPDEFLNLTAGMQFAGFRSVVGTMWAMADYAGPPLVDEFYRKMLLKKRKVDHTTVAQALHGATKKLWMDRYPLAVWINFVHWGA